MIDEARGSLDCRSQQAHDDVDHFGLREKAAALGIGECPRQARSLFGGPQAVFFLQIAAQFCGGCRRIDWDFALSGDAIEDPADEGADFGIRALLEARSTD